MREVVQHAATIAIVEPGQQRVGGVKRCAVALPLVDGLAGHAKDRCHFAEGFGGSSHVIPCSTPLAAAPASAAGFL